MRFLSVLFTAFVAFGFAVKSTNAAGATTCGPGQRLFTLTGTCIDCGLGHYKPGTNALTSCTQCPDINGNTTGAGPFATTHSRQATSSDDCFFPPSQTLTDDKGTFKFACDCTQSGTCFSGKFPNTSDCSSNDNCTSGCCIATTSHQSSNRCYPNTYCASTGRPNGASCTISSQCQNNCCSGWCTSSSCSGGGDGGDQPGQCPGGNEFNDVQDACSKLWHQWGIEHGGAPPNNIFLAHPTDCHWFFECSNAVAYCKQCPGDLCWNTMLDTCDYCYNVGCN